MRRNISDFFDRFGYSTSIKRRLIAYFLIISLLPIILVSYWAYDSGRTSTEGRVTAHLTSVADLKKSELDDWVSERLGDLKTLAEDPSIGLYLAGYDVKVGVNGGSSENGPLFNQVQDKLQSMKTNYGYRRVFIMDSSGEVVGSTEKGDIGRSLKEAYVIMPLATKEVYIEDIFRSPGGEILMVFARPVYGFDPLKKRGISDVLGVLALEMGMEKTVFPMIGNWPGMGQTGETLLVRREGNEVVFLNELRHRRGSALNLRIPVDSTIATPAIFASEGDEGILRARDYRGVEVLSAYRNIHVMGWGFVAKIDSDEAFAAVTSLRSRIIIFSSLLILAAMGLAFWISRGITGPILYLEKLTKRIAHGNFSMHPEVETRDEIGSLADSFGKMERELGKSRKQLMDYSRTLEKKVEERTKELKESEEKYRTLVENADDAILLTDLKGRHIFRNSAYYTSLGFDEGDDVDLDGFSRVHPDDVPILKNKMAGLLEKGTLKSEYRVRHKDGHWVYRSAKSVVVYDNDNKPEAILAIIRDITERKLAEQELQKQHEEIKTLKEFNEKIVQSMQDGVMVEDEQGVITYLNPQAEKMLGYAKDELIGRHWRKIVSKRFLKKVEKEMAQRPKGMASRYECEVVRKNGDVVPIINSATPLFEEGEFKGVLSVFTDISEQKEMEEKLRKKLMKYRLEWGRMYYADEPTPKLALDAFLDLHGLGYPGAVIARLTPDGVGDMIEGKAPVLWLSEKAHKLSIAPDFPVLLDKIEALLTMRKVILFQGLEYLISKHGYGNTLEFMHGLNELFYIENAMLLLSLDSKTLSGQQLELLKKEARRLVPKRDVEMPEKYRALLRYVYERNSAGIKPSHSEVCKHFKITRNTARARIKYLVARELLGEKLKGRSKVLELTELGKDYF